VDDGSRDETPRRLADLAALDRRVRVLTHPVNRGVGAAMRTGLSAARGDVVVVYDADRTYPPEDIPRLAAALEDGADVATASPFAAGGGSAGVPFGRRLLSRAAASAYRLVVGPRAGALATFTCAFRAYRRSALADLEHQSDGFGAAAEILGRLLLSGRRVVEVPSRLSRRLEGRSKLRLLSASREHLRVLRRLLRLRLRPGRPRGMTAG
jgi:dolichol-phosphate mannosyltransferase